MVGQLISMIGHGSESILRMVGDPLGLRGSDTGRRGSRDAGHGDGRHAEPYLHHLFASLAMVRVRLVCARVHACARARMWTALCVAPLVLLPLPPSTCPSLAPLHHPSL